MKTQVSYKKAIQLAILFLMLLAIVIIWPLKIIRPYYYEGDLDKEASGLVQNEGTIVQEFTATRPELSYIEFYVYNEDLQEMEDGELVYRLFDENLNKLDEKQFSVDELKIPGICKIRVRGELEVGKRYYFSLENPNTGLIFSVSDGVNLDARYAYHTYFSKIQYAIYALIVFLVGGMLLFISQKIPQRSGKEVRTDYGIRLVCSLILTMGALGLAWNVFPLRKFSTDWVNILFFETGIGLFIVVTLYGLLHKGELPERKEISVKEIAGKVPALLQILAFAGVMTGCISYVNALSMHYQQTATRTILIYFALAIIFGFSKKEVLNWYNPVYLLCAVAGSICYCMQNSADDKMFELAKGSAAVVTLWGLVILNVIRMLICHKQYHKQKISKVYMVTMVLLLTEIIRSRNTRIWPIEIAFFFGLFAFRAVGTGKTKEFLNHFVNGVFVNFIGVSIYAMLFRPFHRYIHTRYASVFHTATVAAVYDVMVLLLALARFLAVYRREKKIKAVWKELVLMGLAGAFTILTVSRTAYSTIIIVGAFALILTTIKEYKDGLLGGLKRAGICIGCNLVFFVIVYSGCRLMPAIVSQPYTYDVEWFIDSICRGEELDSERYVTVQRFFEVFADKLGIKDEPGLHPEKEQQENNGVESQENSNIQPDIVNTSEVVEMLDEFSSGRIQVFKAYLENLDWKGHETMALQDENGQMVQGHAHNTFIQAAYDFGIGAGVFFMLFCAFVCVRGLYYYMKHLGENNSLTPVIIAGAFCVSGMVEWVFQPHIPLGFAFLLVWMLLIPSQKNEQNLSDVIQKKGQNEKND